MAYSNTPELDRYFLEWGQVYLRRMWSQDLIGTNEKIGGNQFNEYLGVLAALSGRAQKHLCYASIMMGRCPELDLRNLLTTFYPYDEFLVSTAKYLDADVLQIQKLLASLTLEPLNKDIHLGTGSTAWAPVVRATLDHVILPLYGLEINPFLFLLRDLEMKYPKDWSEAANNREGRWLTELKDVFRRIGWRVAEKTVPLREGGRTVTDVDFLAYDENTNEIALFQLKWQKPVSTLAPEGAPPRTSAIEGNRWLERVHAWIAAHGLAELCQRAGLSVKPGVLASFFILARYNALFPGVATRDIRASWVDWNHLLHSLSRTPGVSPNQLVRLLEDEAKSILSSGGESTMFPLSDLSIILNPVSEPEGRY